MNFTSSWSTSLKVMTLIAVAILSAVTLLTQRPLTIAIASGVVLLSALFMVRRLELHADQLVIRRPGWSTRYDLKGLREVRVSPEAMEGSLRIFGIGGLFSYVGLFRNSRLGWYRAYATDPRRAVVLRFADRTVVVTPENPQTFASAVEASRGLPRS